MSNPSKTQRAGGRLRDYAVRLFLVAASFALTFTAGTLAPLVIR